MSDADPRSSAQSVLALARACPPDKRGEVALVVADLCASPALSDTSDAVGTVLHDLIADAAQEIRLRVAHKLADAAWAPHDLVVSLACDAYPVAQPLLERCMAFLEHDLITVAQVASREHRVTVAGRPDVTARLGEVLSSFGEAEVIGALIDNASAPMSRLAFSRAIEVAETEIPLQEPISRRDDLPVDLAHALYMIAAEGLRRAIAERFDVNPAAIAAVIEASTAEAVGSEPEPPSREDEQAAALVDKLSRARRLGPEVVVSAARDDRLELFDHAIARLAELSVAEVRGAFSLGGVYGAALACRAAGLDKRDFAAVQARLTRAGRLPTRVTEVDSRTSANVFTSLTPPGARDALHRLREDG